MGYIRGVLHGAVIGAVAGICLAPQPGRKTREQLAGFGGTAKEGYEIAQRTVRRVAPLAGAAVHMARREDRTPHPDHVETEMIDVDANVRIHNETNGRLT